MTQEPDDGWRPYITEQIEVDAETWVREASTDVDTYIAEAVAVAEHVLEDALRRGRKRTAVLLKKAVDRRLFTAEKAPRLNLERSAALLVGDTEGDAAANLAARVLYHAERLKTAVARDDTRTAVRQAIEFATAVERAKHLWAWGPAMDAHARAHAFHQEGGRMTGGKAKVPPGEKQAIRAYYQSLPSYGAVSRTARRFKRARSTIRKLVTS